MFLTKLFMAVFDFYTEQWPDYLHHCALQVCDDDDDDDDDDSNDDNDDDNDDITKLNKK